MLEVSSDRKDQKRSRRGSDALGRTQETCGLDFVAAVPSTGARASAPTHPFAATGHAFFHVHQMTLGFTGFSRTTRPRLGSIWREMGGRRIATQQDTRWSPAPGRRQPWRTAETIRTTTPPPSQMRTTSYCSTSLRWIDRSINALGFVGCFFWLVRSLYARQTTQGAAAAAFRTSRFLRVRVSPFTSPSASANRCFDRVFLHSAPGIPPVCSSTTCDL